ncbi:MAG TPA: hypothetical protein VG755_13920 [Nannocystaceae bacterium]|nr:hypothetical protein [Nannocystaceae bacterium]
MRSLRRWFAAAVIAAALGPSGFATAAAPLRSNPSTLPKGDVRNKYEQGARAYEGADYAKAGKQWAELLGKLPETPSSRTMRASLVIDTMSAYQAAYEANGDIAMLKAGMDAYYGYFKAYRDAHGSTNIPEPVVEARFVMKEALEHAEAGGNQPNNGTNGSGGTNGGGNTNGTGTDGTSAGVTNGNGSAGNNNAANAKPKRGRGDRSESDSATPLIASGAVLLALGAGASSMIAVGAVEGSRARQDQKLPGYSESQRMNIDQRGRSMNSLLIAGAVVTPVLVLSGISLIAAGAVKRHKAQIAIAPSVSTKFTGIVLRGRF